jgi:hypothetical protein
MVQGGSLNGATALDVKGPVISIRETCRIQHVTNDFLSLLGFMMGNGPDEGHR